MTRWRSEENQLDATEWSNNFPLPGRIACCPAPDRRPPATKASHIICGNNTSILDFKLSPFWIFYVFFLVFPRRLIVVYRRFGTLCMFHLHRLDMKYEVLHISYPAYEDGTDRVFRNVGIQHSDAGEIPKRIHTKNTSIFSRSWWCAYRCPKYVEQIMNAIKHSVASSWFSSLCLNNDGRTHIHQIQEMVCL